MKSLKTLIKLHKKELDDLVKQISSWQEKKNIHEITLKKLQLQILEELKKYSGTEYIFMLDNYMKSAEENEKKLKEEIKVFDKQISDLKQKLEKQFAELKKFEIALENHQHAEKEALRKQEIKNLDEFNVIKFIQNKSQNL